MLGFGMDDFAAADDGAAQDAPAPAGSGEDGEEGDGGGRYFALHYEAQRPPCGEGGS